MPRYAARIDTTHTAIVSALRGIGASVSAMRGEPGLPDLLVSYRGQWIVMEVKSEKGRVRPGQKAWHDAQRAPVYLVRTPEDAVTIVTNMTRRG